MISALSRLAGRAINLGGKGIKAVGKNSIDPAYAIGDLIGGGMSAALTPGAGIDRLIIGGADTIGSALAGGIVRSIPGVDRLPVPVRMGLDMGAGIVGGGMVGYGTGESIVNAKNGGLSSIDAEIARRASSEIIPMESQMTIDRRLLNKLDGVDQVLF